MYNFLKSVLFLLLLLQMPRTFGQGSVTDIESYTVEDGLSQTTINVIFQDSRGFLWLGTQGGLNRYDGYSFKVYSPQAHKKNSISSNFITCITEDKKGNLWIGTKNGLNRYSINEDKFTNYRHEPGNSQSIASDEVQGVYFDKKGNFWIKTPETLDRMDVNTGKFYHYPFFNNIFNFDNERVNYPILEDNTGKLWLGTKDGLNFFDRRLQLFDRFVQNEKYAGSWAHDAITSIILTRENELWIGTNKGMHVFDRESKTFSQPAFLKKLKDKRIFSLLEDKEGVIWIGSEIGIHTYKQGNNELSKFLVKGEDLEALRAQIISLFQDKVGIVWIGTNRGLLKVNVGAKKFRLLSKNSDPPVNFNTDDIASLYKENNNLWVGTWGGGLNIVDLATLNVNNFDFAAQGNTNLNYIHSIYKDKNQNYWIGTKDGVLHFDPSTGSARNLCEIYNIQGCAFTKGNRISQIIEDNTGNMWFASHNGLLRLNSSKNDLKAFLHSPSDSTSMPSNINYSIKKNTKGLFWIGTDKGLVKFDPSAGKVLKRTRDQAKIPGNTIIYSLELDEKNNLVWAGTENGLIKFDMNCNILEMYSEDEHLSGNVIYAIYKDNFENLWLSTNRGINKFNIESENIISYDLSDGLQNYEFNLGASFKDKDGTLYFGGISGINAIRPDSLVKNNTVPDVSLTNIEIIDKNGLRNNIKAINNTINLPHGTNLVTLDFASLDYSFPAKNQFKYKFYSNEETEWINLGDRHNVTFTNLKPGEYTFKLIGSNSDMVWNQKGLTYTIKVESPFWLTTVAFYLYALGAILIFLAIYQFRTFQFHKTNKLLKQQEIIAKEMQRQKEELSIKNKNITDSINYAKRIQEALMPSERQIKKAFPNSFVLLKPKDIVSGDFYWISERNDKVFVAAIDCTGHGVPGAFMSIIGYELFRKVTNNQSIESAAGMLTVLNKEFEAIFKDVDNFTLRDGMDIAFVIIDKINRTLEFSGAINPMYLIRNNKIIEIRGSRFSIGIEEDSGRDQFFESNKIELEPDDVFYLFSDGYADQFGGPEGKKFKYRRFRHLLLTIHKFPMEEQLQLLEERLESWKGEMEQVDDILIIGIKPTLC